MVDILEDEYKKSLEESPVAEHVVIAVTPKSGSNFNVKLSGKNVL